MLLFESPFSFSKPLSSLCGSLFIDSLVSIGVSFFVVVAFGSTSTLDFEAFK